jgi:hypothetical protein
MFSFHEIQSKLAYIIQICLNNLNMILIIKKRAKLIRQTTAHMLNDPV